MQPGVSTNRLTDNLALVCYPFLCMFGCLLRSQVCQVSELDWFVVQAMDKLKARVQAARQTETVTIKMRKRTWEVHVAAKPKAKASGGKGGPKPPTCPPPGVRPRITKVKKILGSGTFSNSKSSKQLSSGSSDGGGTTSKARPINPPGAIKGLKKAAASVSATTENPLQDSDASVSATNENVLVRNLLDKHSGNFSCDSWGAAEKYSRRLESYMLNLNDGACSADTGRSVKSSHTGECVDCNGLTGIHSYLWTDDNKKVCIVCGQIRVIRNSVRTHGMTENKRDSIVRS